MMTLGFVVGLGIGVLIGVGLVGLVVYVLWKRAQM
jgi:hypothetical protein